MENKIVELLCKLGVCDENSFELFYPKVRDRDDISVMRCKKSGVLFTSTSKHVELSYYAQKNNLDYWNAKNRKQAVLNSLEDDLRRKAQFKHLICNKKWLDFGTGHGGILDLLSPIAEKSIAVELQTDVRELLIKEGYEVYSEISQVPFNDFDIVTFFHVFEHLADPLEILKAIHDKMNGGAKIIIEVPHANDFLLAFLKLDEFKKFTFWSEHLILHTRASLKILLEKANFRNVIIKGFQRYPLANHLYWVKEGKPSGHIIWNELRTEELDAAYSNLLKDIDMTDTLIAIAEK